MPFTIETKNRIKELNALLEKCDSGIPDVPGADLSSAEMEHDADLSSAEMEHDPDTSKQKNGITISSNKKKKIQKSCKELLGGMDINGLVWENREVFCKPIARKLDKYFLTRKQKLFQNRMRYEGRYYDGLLASRVRISQDNFGQFIESFLDEAGNLDKRTYGEVVGHKPFHKYLLEIMKKEWPDETADILDTLKKADRLSSGSYETVFLSFLKSRKIRTQVRDYVCTTYNAQKIENLLAKNPAYRNIYKRYREIKLREIRIRQGLLNSIPATYPELFPLARQKQRQFILHVGPTNSGKSYEAVEALKNADSGIYLAPLRLLAYEKYEELNEAGCYCSLKTGEEEIIVPGATLQSSTIEILDYSREYDVAVIDEAQMVADSQRGSGWTFALLGVNASVVHVCLAPEAEDVVKDIIRACGDSFEVRKHERLVPLVFQKTKKEIYPDRIQKGDALIVFSRRDVHAVAAELQHKKRKCSVIYGNLPYDVRRNEVRRYQNGETDLVVATDAIGMGVNLPIRRIVFLELDKFDGKERRDLNPQEIKQIAGRAGRYGIFDEGLVAANEGGQYVKTALQSELPQIKKARIGFPYTLLGIEGKASELMEKWCEIRPKPGFEVADLSREIQLAKELEEESEDKQLVYEFVMFPFDEQNVTLKEIWLDLFRKENSDLELDYMKYLPPTPAEDGVLADLEYSFKVCDLLYHYAEKFTDKNDLPVILKRKNEISDVIIKILEQENLERRKCRRCGRPLPFLYPHGICQRCHDCHKWKSAGQNDRRKS